MQAADGFNKTIKSDGRRTKALILSVHRVSFVFVLICIGGVGKAGCVYSIDTYVLSRGRASV